MPIRDRLYLKHSCAILEFLLENNEKIRAWRNLDYGLHESAFNTKENSSRKIFQNRKLEFLESKFIKPIRTTTNRKYYSITPLGISWLIQNENDLKEGTAIHIFKFLEHFYRDYKTREGTERQIPVIKLDYNIWKKLEQGFSKKLLLDHLMQSCKTIQIDNHVITCFIQISDIFVCNVARFEIINGTIFIKYLFESDSHNTEISDEEFYENISRHISLSFFLLLLFYAIKDSSKLWKADHDWKKDNPITLLKKYEKLFYYRCRSFAFVSGIFVV